MLMHGIWCVPSVVVNVLQMEDLFVLSSSTHLILRQTNGYIGLSGNDCCRRAFSCTGLSAWNSLPEYLTVDTLTLDSFKRSLKCFLFAMY